MEPNKDLKKWWLSIDGDLDPIDQQQFEEALEKDADLAETFSQAQLLDKVLEQQEAEQPSMRFSKNIFEQLPQLYRKINIEPLFSKKALTIGVSSVLAFILLSVALAFIFQGSSTSEVDSSFWTSYVQQLSSIPDQWLLSIGLVSFCIFSVILLDRFLKKQILQKKQELPQ